MEVPVVTPRKSSHPNGIFNLPPKKVIRALMGYTAQAPLELTFSAGDFFYVINETNEWFYEVINPLQKLRGLVPKTHFDTFEKRDPLKKSTQNETPSINVSDSHPPGQNHQPPAHQNDDNERYLSVYSSKSGGSRRTSNGMTPRSSYHGGNSSTSRTNSGSGMSDLKDPEKEITFIGKSTGSGATRSHDHSTDAPLTPNSIRSSQIISANIQTHEIRSGYSIYAIEVLKDDGLKQVLHRTYEDFWGLHISLLNHFPDEAGRKSHSRIIPFLSPPDPPSKAGEIRNLSPGYVQTQQHQLNIYLEELIKLSVSLLESQPAKRFFTLRNRDTQELGDPDFDVSETLIDMISDYKEDGLVEIKVSTFGGDTLVWKVPDTISFDDFIADVDKKFKYRFRMIVYKDESGELVPLRGDEDLRLLLRTFATKTCFYIE
ncbi:bud emergence protein 1 [Nowakowskiella sp. JEL0407]|nr:bud emergence protein 1 [Nowakowskiella sp. JEL0407]